MNKVFIRLTPQTNIFAEIEKVVKALDEGSVVSVLPVSAEAGLLEAVRAVRSARNEIRSAFGMSEPKKRFEVFTPRQLCSKNERDKMHPLSRNHERKQWQSELYYALKALGMTFSFVSSKSTRATHGEMRTLPVDAKQRLTITRVLGAKQHEWDTGNMQGGTCVELQDALKHLGLYHDDSPRWLETVCIQDASDRKNAGTRIVLEVL